MGLRDWLTGGSPSDSAPSGPIHAAVTPSIATALNSMPQAIKVANEILRPQADAVLSAYWMAKTALSVSIVSAQDWNNLFPALNPTDEINDGARQDGRAIVTNDDAQKVMTAMANFVSYMEANNNQELKRWQRMAVRAIAHTV